MHRFLLHNFMFTYGIDPDHFRNHLLNAGCDLLSPVEKDYMLSLGRDLQVAYKRIRNNRFSLLVVEECMRIVEDIVIPAHNLNIEPGYLCEQLVNFPDHEFDKEKRDNARIYNQATRKSFWRGIRKWDTKEARTHLAKCLVSDDYVVEWIAPSQDVQVLIGKNIESFSDKHCKKGIDMGNVDGKVHVSEHTQRMLDAVMLRAEQPVQEPQRRKSFSASTNQRPALLGHQPSIRANVTLLTDVNEVDEPEPNRTP